jgi:molecular chaperone DnaK (HSP70)
MASRKAELDDELKRLHGLPLGEFTAARNALAKQLDKAGKKKEADEVKALVKPTPSAWVVNQLFARETGKMDRLLGAGERARAAQREAVAGAGAGKLRETMAAVRDVAEELRQKAAAILSEEGRAPSRAMLDRVATNLQALAFSPAAAQEASRGWLSRDLDPPGFEVFTGLKIPARVVNIESRRKPSAPEPEPPRTPEKKQAAKASKAEEAAERRRQAAEEKREAAERARKEREAAKHRERVTRAEERVERAVAEEDFLRRKAEQSEKTAEEARRRAEAAQEEAEEARRRADRAAEALARAREALAEVRKESRS